MLLSAPSATRTDRTRAADRRTLAAALAVSLVAFLLYRATLLPGVDLGDSGSFQTMVGSQYITPRDAYPLYFAIGAVMLKLTGAEPAHALNLTSAIEAAVACGLFVVVAAALTESIAAAVAGALLFAVSYTFWSQSVTAEVYALHTALSLATLLLLFRWERQPTIGRLAAFFAVYALAFGNHLSMILLMPALVVFLFLTAPGGWRSLVAPRVIALAIAIAGAGTTQYLWNVRTLWFRPDPPAGLWDALTTFWFDVTKSDWRESMVMQVPPSMRTDHLAMYWFDLRQQFGLAGIVLAGVGAVFLAVRRPRHFALVAIAYLANFAFAFSYNVGDAHVFYLPSHVMVALAATCGASAIASLPRLPHAARLVTAALLAAYAAARGYRDVPALDRSHDFRAAERLATLTDGLDDQHAIFLVDLNWQLANGVSYYTTAVRPEVAIAFLPDVLPQAPALIRDNVAAGRRVALTERARDVLTDIFHGTLDPVPDFAPSQIGPISDAVRALAPGTRYALAVLKPTKDYALDRADLDAALRLLSSSEIAIPSGDYAVMAGVVGQAPSLVTAADFPFTVHVSVSGVPVDVRMESWLAADTIRRMGFGHIIAAHRHTLIVERGVSFVAFDQEGSPLATEYAAGLFARPRRHLIGTSMVR